MWFTVPDRYNGRIRELECHIVIRMSDCTGFTVELAWASSDKKAGTYVYQLILNHSH